MSSAPPSRADLAVFTRSPATPGSDGSPTFAPTDHARGPWHAETQHGSPALGLLARAVERHPGGGDRVVTRLTVDLLRAAPMAPVWTRSRIVRSGRAVEVVEASLFAGGEPDAGADDAGLPPAAELVARATAMRVAARPAPLPDTLRGAAAVPSIALADQNPPIGFSEGGRTVFHHALEMSPVPGRPRSDTEGALWLRLRVPLVAGESTSPLVRAAVASDYAYSVPLLLQLRADAKRYVAQRTVAINADATLGLHRLPQGEWLCVDSRVTSDAGGLGTAIAWLFDRSGPVGYASQSFLVRPAAKRPESWERYREGSR